MEHTIRPAMWTSYFIEDSPETMIETFAEKGWHHLELSTEHGEALLSRGNPAKVGAEFRAFAADRGVELSQGHLWLTADITAEEDAELNRRQVVDRLRRWLDLFGAVGVRAAVLHPSGVPRSKETRPRERVLELQVASLSELTAHAAGSGTAICLENVSSAPALEHLQSIIDAVASPALGICLDTGHLNMADGDQRSFIRGADDRLWALHIADNEGATDQHLAPYGRGTVDWPAVVEELSALPYRGLFNFEIPGENRAPREVRLAKLDYLRRLAEILLAG